MTTTIIRAAFCTALAAATAGAQMPNVVFLFADDLGWTDLSTGKTNRGNGSDYYRTPNIDRLATMGLSFDNAYSCGPNCAPTRAALMSGQYAPRTGVYTVNLSNRGLPQFRLLDGAPNRINLHPGIVTLAETLRTAGYATGQFGKWHLGWDSGPSGPRAQGFDVNVAGNQAGIVFGGSNGHFAKADGSWDLPGLPANGIAQQFMAERLNDEALAWMANTSQPFFCYLTHFSVHVPIQAPAPDYLAFQGVPAGKYHKDQVYAGMIKNLDDNVGRVVDFLETTPDPNRPGHALIDNTVVIFYSDNGGSGGYATAGVPGGFEITHQFPLKMGKGTLYEGGIRVPLIVRWDGVVAPDTVDSTPVSTVDFYPTLASIAGAALPPEQALDGHDLGPVLRGRGLSRSSLFWHFPAYLEADPAIGSWRTKPVSVIRRGDFKLHFDYETRSWELYDLAADIGEDIDLSGSRPELVKSMGDELLTWLRSTGAELPRVMGTTTPVPLPDPPGGIGDVVDWRPRGTATTPTAVFGHAMAATDTGVVLFGGMTDSGPSDQTWEFDGVDWRFVATAVRPSMRSHHAACWDAPRRRFVVFGGEAGTLLDDTWELDGTDWSRITPPTAPSPRRGHALVYDAELDVCVLFGGHDGTSELDDTWVFDGTDWSRRTTRTSPSARAGHAMVHDPASGSTILFGGLGGGTSLDDSWVWDGTDWAPLSAGPPPPARSDFAMAWDPLRGRVVVHGGRDANGWALTDTWELTASGWLERHPANRPLSAQGTAAVFDTASGHTLLFGGLSAVPVAQTWAYQAETIGTIDPFGRGCPGSGGTPSLASGDRPWIGRPVAVDVSQLPSGATQVFLVIGFSKTAWAGGALPFPLAALGAPGCDLLVDASVIVRLVGVAGGVSTKLDIPTDPQLVGQPFFVQALVHDPLANPLSLVVSNALEAVVGAL